MNRSFFIAGARYHELLKVVVDIQVGDILQLITEPSNKFDPNAVRICRGESAIFLGYVPKRFSSKISALLEAGVVLICTVMEVNPKAKPWEMCKVIIEEEDTNENSDS